MFCGIDLGTSSVKAAIFLPDGKMVAYARKECDMVSPRVGWSELNPQNYLENVYDVLSAVFNQYKGPVKSIALSSQAQACLPVDKDGKALYNIIVTMDNRTIEQYQYWKANYNEWDVYKKSGVPFSTIYALNKIMWHKQNNPEIYQRAWKFLCVQDYVMFKLTGCDPVIDYSLASRSMMLSIADNKWNQSLLAIAKIDIDKLAKPILSTTVVGKLKRKLSHWLGLSEPCDVIIGGHDQVCGAIGSGVIIPGMMMDACGTVDAMVTVLNDSKPRKAMMKKGLPIYGLVNLKNYITLAINTNGGLFLKWYKNTFYGAEMKDFMLRGKDIYSEIINCSADNPSDMYVLPPLEGAGSPYNDPTSMGAIIGLKSRYNRRDLSKAVLDSLAYEMKLNLLAIEKSTNCIINEIRIIGGGAKTPKWLQIKADVFNKEIVSLENNEAAVLGAAILGAIGIGYFSDIKQAIAQMVKPKRRYIPIEKNVAKYEEHFEEYQEIYKILKPLNKKIFNRINK